MTYLHHEKTIKSNGHQVSWLEKKMHANYIKEPHIWQYVHQSVSADEQNPFLLSWCEKWKILVCQILKPT